MFSGNLSLLQLDADQHSKEISRKNITLNLSFPDHLLIDCYPGQLNQAILNVLINAVYAVEIGGHISLTVTEAEKNISISVKDDGCGIQEEIKDRIFEPFYTTKPVGSGTGLGLSITYKIIARFKKSNRCGRLFFRYFNRRFRYDTQRDTT
ncbi:MAG: ATP-binding protein [Bacteroidota bacterium]|nr:ATP-binding protein [Bacteroidota bacterium]